MHVSEQITIYHSLIADGGRGQLLLGEGTGSTTHFNIRSLKGLVLNLKYGNATRGTTIITAKHDLVNSLYSKRSSKTFVDIGQCSLINQAINKVTGTLFFKYSLFSQILPGLLFLSNSVIAQKEAKRNRHLQFHVCQFFSDPVNFIEIFF